MKSIITIKNLGKKYTIKHKGESRYQTLRDELSHKAQNVYQRLRHPFSPNPKENHTEEFWALKNINLEIKQGDRIGIIGKNGAGKSTLLKILSRITQPTTGKVYLKGSVASLLEVGTGFHPELSGRENIFLNGAILGMSREKIKQRFNEIVDFAEVEKFIDTPIKRYSSGMYVRLAFSVAAHLDPDILLVDEVLSVGDFGFQKRCLNKIDDVANNGRTVIFVSHNISAIQSLCSKAILLENGHCIYNGSVSNAIQTYISNGSQKIIGKISFNEKDKHFNTDYLRLTSVSLLDSDKIAKGIFRQDEEVLIHVNYIIKNPVEGLRIYIQLMTTTGEKVLATDDFHIRKGKLTYGKYTSVCTIPKNLLNSTRYIIKIGVDIPHVECIIKGTECISFRVEESNIFNRIIISENTPAVIAPNLVWRVYKNDFSEL